MNQQADSLGAGQVVPDSAADQTLQQLGENVTNAGRLLADGEWGALWQLVLDGSVGMVASFTPKAVSALFVAVVFYAGYRVVLHTTHGVLRRSTRVGAGMEAVLVRTLRVGDWVEVGDTYGKVTELTLRSTRIQTPNQEEVVFPNVSMVNQALTNHSTRPTLRVDIPFGVAYKEDLDETRSAVAGLVEGDDRVAPDPEPRVVVTELNDSSVDMALHLHLHSPGDALPVRYEYTEKIRKALDEAGIEIPFPHLQLFIDAAEGLRGLQLAGSGGDGEEGAAGTSEDQAD